MNILILGCGWVGEELALSYLNDGNQVFVTCTSEEKKERLQGLGLFVTCANFDVDHQIQSFPKAYDYVLVSVPAASRVDQVLLEKRFENLANYLKIISYSKLIYLSSVGVYPDVDGIFDEGYQEDLNHRLLEAEQQLKRTLPEVIIYRLGGLFGKNRIFAKYFQNKICTTGNQPTNFVHLDDVVALIKEGFGKDLSSGIYNIVAPEHPSKEEVIKASAQKYGFDLPSVFEPKDSFQKVVDGSKIKKALDYTFIHPSPLNF